MLVTMGFSSCSTTTSVLKSPDRDYRFEVAKQMFAEQKYSNASLLLDNVLPGMKNTKSGDEALFMLAMCKYYMHNYDEASDLFKKYYTRSYPSGMYADEARLYTAKSYVKSINPVRLDQTNTYLAITELQNVLEYDPDGKFSTELKELLFQLQDQLVEKEYLAAKLYYDLGDYFMNCNFGGNNFEACVVTAENAIKSYPFTTRKEEFAIMILKAKYELARQSVDVKKIERYNDAIDEYYGFVNEFPNSKYSKQAKAIFEKSSKEVNSKKLATFRTEEEEAI